MNLFWRSISRNRASCTHPEWLPDQDKKDFLILDFKIGGHSNIEYHKFKVSKDSKATDVMTRIFINRIKLLDKKLDKIQKAIIVKKIIEDINSLNRNSFIIREKLPVIKKIESDSFNLEKYVNELNNEIAPLMIFKPGTNAYSTSFILNSEKLFGLILDENNGKIETIRQNALIPMVENVIRRSNLSEIKAKLNELKSLLQDKFWEDLTFEKVEFMIKEIAPLMKYYSPDPKRIIQVDALDIITDVQQFERELKEDDDYKPTYKERICFLFSQSSFHAGLVFLNAIRG